MPIKTHNWDSPSHTYTFASPDLASVLVAAAAWLSHHDNPDLTCTVESHHLYDSEYEWEVKIISWAGWEIDAMRPA